MRSLLRLAARSALSAIFVNSGVQMLQNPGRYMEQAHKALPMLPEDPRLAQAHGATMAIAGSTFALGILPRLSALVLAATLVPNTYIGHPFWKISDPEARRPQLTHFRKNAGLFGGLALVVLGDRKPRKG